MVDESQESGAARHVGEDPNHVIAQIQEFMKRCAVLLEEGKEPDLSGLDVQVEALCQAIANMSYEESDRMRPRLETLVQQLGELGRSLQEQKDALSQQLGALNNQKQAHSAYQRAHASGSKPSSEHLSHRQDYPE